MYFKYFIVVTYFNNKFIYNTYNAKSVSRSNVYYNKNT